MTITHGIELCKLPVLFEHYSEHKVLDENIGFLEFLRMHYTTNKEYADHEKDMKLPFKSVTDNSLGVVYSVTNFPVLHQHLYTQHFYIKKQFIYQSGFYFSMLIDSIWQPPRA